MQTLWQANPPNDCLSFYTDVGWRHSVVVQRLRCRDSSRPLPACPAGEGVLLAKGAQSPTIRLLPSRHPTGAGRAADELLRGQWRLAYKTVHQPTSRRGSRVSLNIPASSPSSRGQPRQPLRSGILKSISAIAACLTWRSTKRSGACSPTVLPSRASTSSYRAQARSVGWSTSRAGGFRGARSRNSTEEPCAKLLAYFTVIIPWESRRYRLLFGSQNSDTLPTSSLIADRTVNGLPLSICSLT